ncbi:MAG: transposase [Solirubrobacteraceae bacterium]
MDTQLRPYARRQAGCKALIDAYYGVGELVAATVLAELGDCRRFSNSRDAVRYGGMDITVYESDRHRAPGHLSRQGPPALRWALYEAAQVARRPTSPDREYYLQAAEKLRNSAVTAPVSRSHASCSSAATTPCESSAMTPSRHQSTSRRVADPRAARQAAVPPPTNRRPATREPTGGALAA